MEAELWDFLVAEAVPGSHSWLAMRLDLPATHRPADSSAPHVAMTLLRVEITDG